MVPLSEKKLAFIREVSGIEDERTLAALIEAYHEIIALSKINGKPATRTPRRNFDADAIRRRRGHAGHDKAKIMQLIHEMDVQEPLEQLLSQLTK